MIDLSQRFDRIYIDERSLESRVAKRFIELSPPSLVEVVSRPPRAQEMGRLSADQFSRSKREVFLTEFKGQFFKRCPGARPGLTCCNYFVLNLGLQCDMNCSYCYLQSFINSPTMVIYTNIGQALEELEQLADPKLSFRIGTGEVIDSLSLDDITLYSRELIEFFRRFPNWRLEFKTKSDRVDQFLDCEHAGNVIVSWSINPQYIIEREEHKTASLSARLDAAKKCLDKGFIVSFHIDPVIYHPEWEASYDQLVDEICQRFTPNDIPYMSLGALRFQPEQRHIMRQRFGMQSLVTQAEMFVAADGKFRYDRRLREMMFDRIVRRFKDHNPNWNIFLCMETPETWLGTYHAMPKTFDGLKDLFDHQVTRSFHRKHLEVKA